MSFWADPAALARLSGVAVSRRAAVRAGRLCLAPLRVGGVHLERDPAGLEDWPAAGACVPLRRGRVGRAGSRAASYARSVRVGRGCRRGYVLRRIEPVACGRFRRSCRRSHRMAMRPRCRCRGYGQPASRRKSDAGNDHFCCGGFAAILIRRPLPATIRPSGRRSISGASTGPRAYSAIFRTSPLGARSVIGP